MYFFFLMTDCSLNLTNKTHISIEHLSSWLTRLRLATFLLYYHCLCNDIYSNHHMIRVREYLSVEKAAHVLEAGSVWAGHWRGTIEFIWVKRCYWNLEQTALLVILPHLWLILLQSLHQQTGELCLKVPIEKLHTHTHTNSQTKKLLKQFSRKTFPRQEIQLLCFLSLWNYCWGLVCCSTVI